MEIKMRALIEVLIYDIKDPKDKGVVKLVRSVASIYEGVEVRVFEYYGPHEHPYSLGILDAYKIHAVPAIAVNGNLICIGESPSKEDLSTVVEVAIKTRRFREKRE